jgi:hypothetical protein
MPNFVLVLGAFSAATAAVAIRVAWQNHRARSWPTVEGTFVKDRESGAERWLRHNLDSGNADADYCLEWTIAGIKYRRRLKNKSQLALEGFVVASAALDLKPQIVRYNPRKPSWRGCPATGAIGCFWRVFPARL